MNASLGVSVISSLNLSNLNETEKNPIVPLNTFTMEAISDLPLTFKLFFSESKPTYVRSFSTVPLFLFHFRYRSSGSYSSNPSSNILFVLVLFTSLFKNQNITLL